MSYDTHSKPDCGAAYAALMELSVLAQKMAEQEPLIAEATRLVAESLSGGGKVLACGNGGSAADAQHFIAEFVGHLERERRPLPGITLNVDPSIMTAVGNDYGYDEVFARQVTALGKPGDVLIGISTSGRSANVLKAFEAARKIGLRTIALVGEGGSPALEECDVSIHTPTRSTQRIQELHTAVLHAICEGAEKAFL